MLADVRHGLNRRRSRPDDRHALVGELVEAAGGVSARVLVVPAARVKDMPLEVVDPRDGGQLGTVEGAAAHDDESSFELVAAIGLDRPAPGALVPAGFGDLRLEAGVLVQVEVLADPFGVLEDLGREGVLLLWYVSGLFQERQIDVGLDVALSAGITVPVPGPAEVPGLLDDADVGDSHLLQSRRGQQAAEAAADDHRVELFMERGAGKARIDVGILFEMRVL